MNRLMSTKYSAAAFNAGMLLLRAGMTLLLIPHGYDKLVKFAEYKTQFINFLGIGQPASLGLAVFSEFFCAIFVLMGLFTRLATIPIIISMSVALFQAHHGDILKDGEHAAMYIVAFLVILILGPGKASIDGATGH